MVRNNNEKKERETTHNNNHKNQNCQNTEPSVGWEERLFLLD